MSICVSIDAEPKVSRLPYTAELPCKLGGGFQRFRSCTPSFYAIGKIEKNGWRDEFGVCMPNSWQEYLSAAPVSTNSGFMYTGPFFIKCNHGCTHGNESHATYSPCTAASSSTTEANDFRAERVFRQCEAQIRGAGFALVWAGEGSDGLDTAYGSLVEVGIAHALRKPILLVHHPNVDLRDFWFLVETAAAVICAERTADALHMLWAERSAR